MNLAFKDIKYNLGRFVITALGIGMLLMVVMGMSGIYRGIIEDATLLIDKVGADIWIVQKNTKGPFAESSKISPDVVYRAKAIPGVKTARAFSQHSVQRKYEKKQLRMSIVGLDWPVDTGKWLQLISGKWLSRGHYQMIVDKSFGLKLGEKIKLGKNKYTVVGITSGMIDSAGDGIAFFTISDALNIQFDDVGEAIRLERNSRDLDIANTNIGITQPGLTAYSYRNAESILNSDNKKISAVILKLNSGVNVDRVINIISGWKDVSAFTTLEERNFLLTGSVEKIKQQIGLFRILLIVISAIIMALILYTLTLDKLHSIALLKLIGASNWNILRLILQQAIILGGAGYGVAFFLGTKVFPHFPRRVILENSDLIELALIVLIISIVSSLLGINKALKIKPNQALN
jgi:putative ABC transport system permease protein